MEQSGVRRQYALLLRPHAKAKAIAMAVASCFVAHGALANPYGLSVVNGQVSARQNGNTLSITNSPGSIINWQGFSVGSNEVTRFIQQSAASTVLNRVVGVDPSIILGTLQSNGRVFLLNPNGVLFGAGSTIDVAGLVASTLNLSNADFLAGRMRFTDTPGAANVVNQGTITTPSGGQVYLVAPNVENHGVISSPQGEVILAAGKTIDLVDSGTPNLRVQIDAPDNQAVNIGQIIANSGKVGIYAGLIRNSGIIRADGVVRGANGEILLKATKNVTVEAGSTLSASGAAGGTVTVQSGDTTLVAGAIEATGSSGNGGNVQVLGNLVGITDRATINASGSTGGGNVLVGGDYQGANAAVQNAAATYFSADATIKADATDVGNGGKVILWADNATRSYGSISARGGANGGDGGFVENSGKQWLDFSARVDTRAPFGRSGMLLLDPTDITISTDATSGGNCFSMGCFTLSGNPATANLNVDDLVGVLGFGSVTVSTNSSGTGNGDITVNAPINYNYYNDLTLLAVRDINVVGNNIVNSGTGALNLNAGRNISVQNAHVSTVGALNLTATNNLSVIASTAATSLASMGGQTILARGITVQGAESGTNLSAEIFTAGQQDITVGSNGLSVKAGAGGSGNSAMIKQSGGANNDQLITVNDGGLFSIEGGGGINNKAAIMNFGRRQELTFTAGGELRLQGGSGASGNQALIENGTSTLHANSVQQNIKFTGGGSINITGGTNGTDNAAGISAYGDQTIRGNNSDGSDNPNIMLIGGASGGALNAENAAFISLDGGSTAAQTINAHNISLTGGAGGTLNVAAIGTELTGMSAQINATGSVALAGGAGTDALAVIGSNSGDVALSIDAVGPVTLTGGSGGAASFGAFAQIGAIGAHGGSVTLSSDNGVTLTAGTGSGAWAAIGVQGPVTAATVAVNAGSSIPAGITLRNPVGGAGAFIGIGAPSASIVVQNAALQANGPITFTASAGDILLSSANILSAGVTAGQAASIAMTTGSGNGITIQNNSLLGATGAAGGPNAGPSGDGGAAAITLSAGSEGIVVAASTLRARGGDGVGRDGGAASISLSSNGNGGIVLSNYASLQAMVGGGSVSAATNAGGLASISLDATGAGGITLGIGTSLYAQGGNSYVDGGDATITLTSGAGGIILDGGAVVAANGGYGGDGGVGNRATGNGGNAQITLSSGGGISISGNARLLARGAKGGYYSDNGNGGNATINLTNTGGTGIAVDGAEGYLSMANGGDAGLSSGNAGSATITLDSGGQLVKLDNVAGFKAEGGNGYSGNGGAADISFNNAGSILLDNRSFLYARAGSGAADNGDASISLSIAAGATGAGGAITLNRLAYLQADGGSGGNDGSGNSSITLNAGSGAVLLDNGAYAEAYGGENRGIGGGASVQVDGLAVTLSHGADLYAEAGDGNSGGGAALVDVTTSGSGGIQINSGAYVQTVGGDPTTKPGGNATVKLTAGGSGAVTINGGDISAVGGDGSPNGIGLVWITTDTGNIALQSGTITADGAPGSDIKLHAWNSAITGNGLSGTELHAPNGAAKLGALKGIGSLGNPVRITEGTNDLRACNGGDFTVACTTPQTGATGDFVVSQTTGTINIDDFSHIFNIAPNGGKDVTAEDGGIRLLAGVNLIANDGVSNNGNIGLHALNGTIQVDSGAGLTTVGGVIALWSDTAIDLRGAAGSINAGTSGVVALRANTAGQVINIGGATGAGILGINSAGLSSVSAGTLRIGDLTNTGGINVFGAVNLTGTNTLSLATLGNITQTAPLSVSKLAIKSAGDVTLSNSGNLIGTLAADMTAATGTLGTLTFGSSSGYAIGTADGIAGISGAAVNLTADTLSGPGLINAPVVNLTTANGMSVLVGGNGAGLSASNTTAGDIVISGGTAGTGSFTVGTGGAMFTNTAAGGSYSISALNDMQLNFGTAFNRYASFTAAATLTANGYSNTSSAGVSMTGGAVNFNAYTPISGALTINAEGTINVNSAVTANSMSVIAGNNLNVSATTGPAYLESVGNQTISASGALTVQGGSGSNQFARIKALGSQSITAGAASISASSFGTDNDAAIVAPTQTLTFNGGLTLNAAAGGGARIGGLSGGTTSLALTTVGSSSDIQLIGSTTNGAAIGSDSNGLQSTAITIVSGRDVLLNAGSGGGARIGSPGSAMAGGNISITAGRNIQLTGSSTKFAAINTTANVTLNAVAISDNSYGSVKADQLQLTSTGNVSLLGQNSVSALGASTIGGNFSFNDFSMATPGTLAINDAVAAVGSMSLGVAGNVTQDAVPGNITAAGLELLGANGNYFLTNSANNVGVLAGNTGTVKFRDNTGFDIGSVNTVGLTTSGNTTLYTAGTVTQSQSITAAGLELLGTGAFNLNGANNAVTTLAGNTGSVKFRDNTGFDIGSVNTVGLTTSGNTTLDTTATVTQSQAITSAGLELLGAAGTFNLDGANNAVTTLAGNTGIVKFRDNTGFDIGSVNTVGLTTSGNTTLDTTATVTQSQAITASGLELLGTGGVFNLNSVNNAITTLAGNTGTVKFRDNTGFDIGSVNTVGLTTSGNTTLDTTATVTQSQAITAPGLELLGTGGTFNLNSVNNAITTLAGNTGTVKFRDNTGFDVGSVNTVGLTTSGNTTLDTTATVTQSQAITAAGLELVGAGGSFNLASVNNAITTLAGNTGSVKFKDNTGFAIGTVNALPGVTVSGSVAFDSASAVTQSQKIVAPGLELLGAGGTYTLTNAANNVDTLATNTGSVSYVDLNALLSGSVGGTTGIAGSAAVNLTADSLTGTGSIAAPIVNLTTANGMSVLVAGSGSGLSAANTTSGDIVLTGGGSTSAVTGAVDFSVGGTGASFTNAAVGGGYYISALNNMQLKAGTANDRYARFAAGGTLTSSGYGNTSSAGVLMMANGVSFTGSSANIAGALGIVSGGAVNVNSNVSASSIDVDGASLTVVGATFDSIAANFVGYTTGNVVVNTGGRIKGNPDVVLTVGGNILLDSGGKIEAASPNSVRVTFPSAAGGGYIVNGVPGLVADPATGTGFYAAGLPASVGSGFVASYGIAPVDVAPTAATVAATTSVAAAINTVVNATNTTTTTNTTSTAVITDFGGGNPGPDVTSTNPTVAANSTPTDGGGPSSGGPAASTPTDSGAPSSGGPAGSGTTSNNPGTTEGGATDSAGGGSAGAGGTAGAGGNAGSKTAASSDKDKDKDKDKDGEKDKKKTTEKSDSSKSSNRTKVALQCN